MMTLPGAPQFSHFGDYAVNIAKVERP